MGLSSSIRIVDPAQRPGGDEQKLDVYQSAYAHLMRRTTYEAMAGEGAGTRLADAAWCRPTRDEWTPEGDPMGTDDKIDNKAEELKGKVKEGAGEATDDRDLQTEGKADQAKGNLKQAGEKIKDAFKS
jgi:uncharacterized protein YjbJ (UPF0337 family)